MRAEARGLSGMLMASTPTDFRKRAPSSSLRMSVPLRRNDLDHGDEFAGGDFRPSRGALLAWGRPAQPRATALTACGLHARLARASPTRKATSSRECARAWFRSIRRPGARPRRRTSARSSPCIPASTDKYCVLRPSGACRRWAARPAAGKSRRARAPWRPAWRPDRRCNCSR